MATIGGTPGVENMLQSLGLSRQFADNVGRALGTGKTNAAALEQLLFSMHVAINGQGSKGVGTGNAPIPPSGFVPNPTAFLQASLAGGTPPYGQGFGGLSGEAPFGSGQLGRSLQIAMLRNPALAKELEKIMGGTMLPNGRSDGRIDVWRPGVRHSGAIMRQAIQRGEVPRSGLTVALASTNVPVQGSNLNSGATGGILKGMMAMEANIKNFMTGMSGQAGQSWSQDPVVMQAAKQAGIDPSRATFEDLIFLQMTAYAHKKEQEIGGKIQALDKSMVAGSAANAEGVMGGLVSPAGGQTAKGIMGQVQGQMVPGRPELGGVQQTGATVPGTGVADPSQMSETMKQQMLSKMMNDLKQMYEMLANILKSMHDMMMTPIRNLKG